MRVSFRHSLTLSLSLSLYLLPSISPFYLDKRIATGHAKRCLVPNKTHGPYTPICTPNLNSKRVVDQLYEFNIFPVRVNRLRPDSAVPSSRIQKIVR